MQSISGADLTKLLSIVQGYFTVSFYSRILVESDGEQAAIDFGSDELRDLKVTQSLLPSLSVGNVASAQLDITVKKMEGATVPKNGRISLYCNVTESNVPSPRSVNSISFGTYYIDTREDVYNGYLHFTAFDAILKADVPAKNLFSESLEFPITERFAASTILEYIGVSYTSTDFSTSTMVEYPNDMTAREVLSAICSAHGCNGYVTPQNNFRMVSLNGNNGTATVGLKCQSLQIGKEIPALSGIRLFWSDGKAFLGGSESSTVLDADCYFATQTLATSAYTANVNYSYKPYRAEKAKLIPIAELGDIVVIDGQNYKLDNIEWSSDGHATIYSPSGDTTEHEFEYVGQVQRELDKRVVLGADYFGNRITRDEGFVSELISNGERVARTVLNGNVFSMQRYNDNTGNWVDAIYFDTVARKYKISGDVLVEAQSDITLRVTTAEFDGTVTDTAVSGSYSFTHYTDSGNYSHFFRSGNYHAGGSASLCIVDFVATSACKVYLDAISDGEQNFDYGMISTVYHDISQQPFSTSNTKETQNVLRDYASTVPGTVDRVVLDLQPGDNYITLKYIKDASVDSGQDRFTVGVRNDIHTRDSVIQLVSGGIVVSSGTISFDGTVTFEDLETSGKTIINGDNITTGLITAEHIKLGGNMEVYQSLQDGASVGGYVGYTTSNISSSPGMALTSTKARSSLPASNNYFNGQCVVTGTGARLSLSRSSALYPDSYTLVSQVYASYYSTDEMGFVALEAYGNAVRYTCTDISGGYAMAFAPTSLGCYLGVPTAYGDSRGLVWFSGAYLGSSVMTTSDRNLKNSISYDLDLYDSVFDALKPARFKYNDGTSGRFHTGFIAQDVEDAVIASGLTLSDLAAVAYDTDNDGNKTYFMRNEELIALCVKQIQELKVKVLSLESNTLTLSEE